jgi:hypothetical protein
MATEGTADERTPGYYRGEGALQPFDVIDAWELDFYEGNAVKYLVRWQGKGGVADLAKAVHYLDKVVSKAKAGRPDEEHHDTTRFRTDQGFAIIPREVITAFALGPLESDVIHRLYEWKASGCVACLLQAYESVRELLAHQPAARDDSKAEAAEVLQAFAEAWAEVLAMLPDQYRCALTCNEAETAADVLALAGYEHESQQLLEAHQRVSGEAGGTHEVMADPPCSGDCIDEQDADDPGTSPSDSTISAEGPASLKAPSGDHDV